MLDSCLTKWLTSLAPTSLAAAVHLSYVGREGTAHEFLPLSLLGLSGVAPVLEILQGSSKVLDIILKLVHSPEVNERILPILVC